MIITEWYAKGDDSGMENLTGAGWTVATQQERGWFYQNFTLALLESQVCVGWHWFKYMDNDPRDRKTDPSNRNSNKGIVTAAYEPWQPLLDAMKQLNDSRLPAGGVVRRGPTRSIVFQRHRKRDGTDENRCHSHDCLVFRHRVLHHSSTG